MRTLATAATLLLLATVACNSEEDTAKPRQLTQEEKDARRQAYREERFKTQVPKAGSFDGTWSIHPGANEEAIGEVVIKTESDVLSIKVDWKDPGLEGLELERRFAVNPITYDMWLLSETGDERVEIQWLLSETANERSSEIPMYIRTRPKRISTWQSEIRFSLILHRDKDTGSGVGIDYQPIDEDEDTLRQSLPPRFRDMKLHLRRSKDDKAKTPKQAGAKADQEAE